MMRMLGVLVGLLASGGCAAGGLNLPSDPVRMTIVQRQTKAIPGSHNGVKVAIQDVTGQQVLLRIQNGLGQPIVDDTSVKEGDVVPFNVGREQYYLSVVELRNFLASEDFAVFDVSTHPPKSRAP